MKLTQLALAISASLAFGTVQAAVVPVGVQNNLSFADVTGVMGWTLTYQNSYSSSDSLANVFAGIGAGDMVMIGSRIHGSDIIEVAAAATLADIQTYTPYNVTHAANGTEWYYNGGSMGFAGLGQAINQGSADTNSSSYSNYYPDDGTKRLSWHTDQNGYGMPTMLIGGWRSGTNIWLNGSTDYDRVVFMAPVPEPETYGMMIAGLGILAFLARRRSQA